jgi:4a-hydroxytetrahydrobiopterin dehydratase
MDAVVVDIKAQRHHPEWSNVYNKVHIRWTTHRPEGLSSKDIGLAKICDEKAAEFGEIPSTDSEQES